MDREKQGREVSVMGGRARGVEEQRRVVTVAAKDRLIETGLAQLLDESADVVRTGGNIEHIGRRWQRENASDLL